MQMMMSHRPVNMRRMVSFTMRLPSFMNDALEQEAAKRVTRLEPDPIRARVIREAVQEWMEKRGLWPNGMPLDGES